MTKRIIFGGLLICRRKLQELFYGNVTAIECSRNLFSYNSDFVVSVEYILCITRTWPS